VSGSIDYSVLYNNGSSGAASSILSILAGAGVSSRGNPLPALREAERNQAADVAQTAAQPQVAREVAAFTKAVATAKSPADLLANPQALDVLLTASGLGNQSSYTALAQRALLSDTADPKGLANQLSGVNALWKTTAKTYDFANKGLSSIQKPGVVGAIANAYAEVVWRQSLDSVTPGLSNALTFRGQASSVTSVDQILGDATMRSVVTGALGIPPEIAYQDLGAQENAISSRLDLKKLQDPKFVEGLVQQYLLSAHGSSASTGSSLDALAAQNQGLVV